MLGDGHLVGPADVDDPHRVRRGVPTEEVSQRTGPRRIAQLERRFPVFALHEGGVAPKGGDPSKANSSSNRDKVSWAS